MVTALLAVLFSPPISRGEVFASMVKRLAKSPFSYSAVIRFYTVRHPSVLITTEVSDGLGHTKELSVVICQRFILGQLVNQVRNMPPSGLLILHPFTSPSPSVCGPSIQAPKHPKITTQFGGILLEKSQSALIHSGTC